MRFGRKQPLARGGPLAKIWVWAPGRIVTLVWTGDRAADWGFWVRVGEAELGGRGRYELIPWRRYIYGPAGDL